MKFRLLSLCCVFASFSIALAGQARADQEISHDVNKFEYPSYNVFGGWATCQGVSIPWNCSTESDQVSYNLYASWSSGYAVSTVVDFGQQVSAGDTAFSQIALYCTDGTFGDTFYPYGDGHAGDGHPPPTEVYSSCANGSSYEAVFTYGVEATGAS